MKHQGQPDPASHQHQLIASVWQIMITMATTVQDPILREAIHDAMRARGKAVRARLCLMTVDSFGQNPELAVYQAASLELFHLFSLVHDDIMDEAMLRRKRPSTYATYGRDVAILVGDALYALAQEALVNKLANGSVAQAVSRFSVVGREVCDGQAMDMRFESGDWASVADYVRMIEGKTAALIGWAMELGALAAHADPVQQQTCFDIGQDQGVIFQIQDDILDVYGDVSQVGKVHAGDIIQGKQSILTVLCRAAMPPDELARFDQLYRDANMAPHDKVQQVMTYYDQFDTKERAQQMQSQRMDRCMERMTSLAISSQASEMLAAFFESLSARIS